MSTNTSGEDPAQAVCAFEAYLEDEGYAPQMVKDGRTLSTRFAMFLVGRPPAKGQRVRADDLPGVPIPRTETELKTAVNDYVEHLRREHYSQETAVVHRDWAIWFSRFLIGEALQKGERRPGGWWSWSSHV